jgi:hypothetical protein
MERIDKPSSSNRFPRKKQKKKKTFLDTLISSSGFFLVMGLLIIGTGLICYKAFMNPFSKLVLDTGLVLSLFGLGLKVVDIFMKIIGSRV